MEKMNSSQRYLFFGVLLIVICLVAFWVRRARQAPDVSVTEVSYVKSTHEPVFTIYNASSHTVLRSDRCWIVSVTDDGTTDRTIVGLAGGALLLAGKSEHVGLTAPPTQAVWSVEFEVVNGGFAARLPLLSQRYHSIRSRWVRSEEVKLLTNRRTE